LLVYAQRHEVSHQRLTPDCIYVKDLDFKEDTIAIEVDGFDKLYLETMGLSVEAQMDSIIKVSIRQTPRSARYEEEFDNIRADLTSVSIVMFMLLVGIMPFSGNSSRKLLEEAKVGYFSFTHPLWKQVSPSARDFIKRIT
jgi:hypothetical protein